MINEVEVPINGIDITPEDSFVPIFLVAPTDEEIAEREASVLDALKREQDENDRDNILQSAISKLSILGLTEDEAKAVIGL